MLTGISCQNEAQEETKRLARLECVRKEKHDEEKKNKFGKLHHSFKNTLLNASYTDGDVAASDITESCRYFYNQESAGLADQELSLLLADRGYPDVGFSHGVVQDLLNGHMLYFEQGCPNNFSPFCVYEKLHDKHDNQNRLLLHVESQKRKNHTDEEIKDSLRQVGVAPSSFTKLMQQMGIFGAANDIFLGEKAKSTEGISDFIKLVSRNESFLKHACNTDNLLPTKILSVMCSRVQR